MASANDRKRLYAKIPDDTDVLITHVPLSEFSMFPQVPHFIRVVVSFSMR
jgi:hypothetical protein